MLKRFIAWLFGSKDRERLLLEYWDGERKRRADPFKLWRAIQNHPTVNFVDIAPAVDQGEEPATTNCIQAIAEIFDVRRWDESTGTGLTDWEILNLFGDLDDFLLALKKNTSPGSTSSQPTGSES